MAKISDVNIENILEVPVKHLIDFNKSINTLTDSIKNKELAIKSMGIESQYLKIRTEFQSIRYDLVDKNQLITEGEFNYILDTKLGIDLKVSEITDNFNNLNLLIQEIRYNDIINKYSLVSEINLDDTLKKSNVYLYNFLMGKVLEEISKDLASKNMVKENRLIIKKEDFPVVGDVSYLYFNSNPTEEIKLTKINQIINSNGQLEKLKEVFQSHDDFKISLNVDNRMIKIKAPIFYGTLICEKAGS